MNAPKITSNVVKEYIRTMSEKIDEANNNTDLWKVKNELAPARFGIYRCYFHLLNAKLYKKLKNYSDKSEDHQRLELISYYIKKIQELNGLNEADELRVEIAQKMKSPIGKTMDNIYIIILERYHYRMYELYSKIIE
jgi:hypothetical protein